VVVAHLVPLACGVPGLRRGGAVGAQQAGACSVNCIRACAHCLTGTKSAALDTDPSGRRRGRRSRWTRPRTPSWDSRCTRRSAQSASATRMPASWLMHCGLLRLH
jgi:hypothetical protein